MSKYIIPNVNHTVINYKSTFYIHLVQMYIRLMASLQITRHH